MKNDDAFDLVFDGTQRVLAVFAHPDDLEIFCGGTVARLVDERIGVRAVCVTNGGKGVRNRAVDLRDFLDRRVAAQRRAALALGVEDRQIFNLDLEDGGVEDTVDNIGKIVWHIREYRPDIVITHEPQ